MQEEKFSNIFDLAHARIRVEWNIYSRQLELYIISCNNAFTNLTNLRAGHSQDVADLAFGARKVEYLKKLLLNEVHSTSDDHIYYFKSCDRYVMLKIRVMGDGYQEILCIDNSLFQERMKYYELNERGSRFYLENFNGLAVQWIKKDKYRDSFTAGNFKKITGYQAHIATSMKTWFEIIHPDDREMVNGEYLNLFFNSGYNSDFEYRIEKKSGALIWLSCSVSNIESVDEKLNLIQILMIDITQRKHQEIRLEKVCKKVLEQNKILEEQAYTDPLTGLSNRRYAYEEMLRLEERFKRSGEIFSVLLIDLDYFKNINDTYGHQTGDRILCEVADIFKLKLRAMDIKARWGGEEILIVFPDTALSDALFTAKKILDFFRNWTFDAQENSINVTFSGGVGEFREGESVNLLLNSVDQALYLAKERGRNQIIGSSMTACKC